MSLEKIKKNTDAVKEFKLPEQKGDNNAFNLETQKSSLLVYNENIRTAKDISFSNNGRLQIPVFDSDTTICEIGEIALIGGTVKVCTTANTWTAV